MSTRFRILMTISVTSDLRHIFTVRYGLLRGLVTQERRKINRCELSRHCVSKNCHTSFISAVVDSQKVLRCTHNCCLKMFHLQEWHLSSNYNSFSTHSIHFFMFLNLFSYFLRDHRTTSIRSVMYWFYCLNNRWFHFHPIWYVRDHLIR